jgi:hypothetical protein
MRNKQEKENYRYVELLAALGESVGESGGHSWRKRMEECWWSFGFNRGREREVLELDVVMMTTICCSGRTTSGLRA